MHTYLLLERYHNEEHLTAPDFYWMIPLSDRRHIDRLKMFHIAADVAARIAGVTLGTKLTVLHGVPTHFPETDKDGWTIEPEADEFEFEKNKVKIVHTQEEMVMREYDSSDSSYDEVVLEYETYVRMYADGDFVLTIPFKHMDGECYSEMFNVDWLKRLADHVKITAEYAQELAKSA